MRIDKLFIIIIFPILLTIGLGCNGSNPIIISPDTVGLSQTGFVSKITAIYNPTVEKVWFCVPSGSAEPSSKITFKIPGELPLTFLTLDDGSFLYRFEGDEHWDAMVEWTDFTGVKHEDYIEAKLPGEDFARRVASVGLYPNRLHVSQSGLAVVNSGDDEIVFHSPDTFQPTSQVIKFPQYSNPWETVIHTGMGIATTLFNGVYTYSANLLEIYPVAMSGFSDFASPNGVTIVDSLDMAYVTNANPVSYFPTEFGPGWVSVIELDTGYHGKVVDEIPTQWFNPQYTITDGDLVYVSCSGTIDFVPPDFVATALDNGGVEVIDPLTNTIIKSYNLGMGGPGPMAISPSGKYLWIGSGVAGWLYRIDLETGIVLNDASNPIVIDDFSGTFVPFVEISEDGLLATASFNNDRLIFLDSETGEMNPFPFFGPIPLKEEGESGFYGPQDAAFLNRNGEYGLVVLTSVESALHWLPL